MDESEDNGGSKLPIDLKVDVSAKVELKGEIPSDSLGRLVDAVTNAIGPFTERRGLKADQIRLQREEVAIEIAKRALAKAKLEKLAIQPVPAKILVPLLEKGSLENADSPLIEWWVNLLVSAADPNIQTRPYFSDLINKIGSAEAQLLEMLWGHVKDEDGYTSNERLNRMWVADTLEQMVGDIISGTPDDKKETQHWRDEVTKKFAGMCRSYILKMEDSGFIISALRFPAGEESMFFSSEIYREQSTSFQICRALEILHDFEFTHGFVAMGLLGRVYSGKATFFTKLGCEFMAATQRVAVDTKQK